MEKATLIPSQEKTQGRSEADPEGKDEGLRLGSQGEWWDGAV